jgi:hypothetical protein
MARPLYRMGTVIETPATCPAPGCRARQIAARSATYPQPPPAAAVRDAVGRDARGGRTAWGGAACRGRLAERAGARAPVVPCLRSGAGGEGRTYASHGPSVRGLLGPRRGRARRAGLLPALPHRSLAADARR